MSTLLAIRNLKTYFFTSAGVVKAIRGIDLNVNERETLALVGESGCGKSMTALSILRLVPPPGRIVDGEILFRDEDLLRLPQAEMRRIRGNQISMIFQEPMTSLNPVFRISDQIGEVLRLHKNLDGKAAFDAAADLLRQVGIAAPRERLHAYPHNLSGGMRQRVMIAMALAGDPQLLIADEPTTALDVTIQAQIMELLRRLKDERRMATLLITHDLGIVAQSADRVAIMYAGLVMEYADVARIYADPRHPYTQGLLACVPRLGEKRKRLEPIAGQVPDPRAMPEGCPFLERCPEAFAPCRGELPPLREVAPGHQVRCWRS
ncbi:ABC transporter ATP-binding protein [Geoalkalibacter halelectricus]|uniref:ABC transporter ATP-binding protein n=1 Tax=Geoalkalibacter halelectricus TaxID=2847045 RepID=A0ABY5ZPW0_9BACT|nr:ABC transporter ATP-binding protein [Geoalkalibacter halelectricus]MDO3376975.1 ABC transporter ATP-binding protein [Geoalkalibacter halelectricus]UWZ81197.1 ABC transporter ATP-binding protein [Geoalkalibacter halelectricus]